MEKLVQGPLTKSNRRKRRAVLRLEHKLEVINQLEKGLSERAVAQIFNVSRSQIHRISGRRNEVRAFSKQKIFQPSAKHLANTARYPELENAVFEWFSEMSDQSEYRKAMPLTRSIIVERALCEAKRLGIDKFYASNGWYRNWKKRFCIPDTVQPGNEAEQRRADEESDSSEESSDDESLIEDLEEVLKTQLENDMKDYLRYKLMPKHHKLFQIKPGIVPHIFKGESSDEKGIIVKEGVVENVYVVQGTKRFTESEHRTDVKRSRIEDAPSTSVVDIKTELESNDFDLHDPSDPLGSNIKGNRIVSIQYYFEQLQKISLHNPIKGCIFSHLRLLSEERTGLNSQLEIHCENCGENFPALLTDPGVSKNVDLNKSIVTCQVREKLEYDGLKTLLDSVDVPAMSEEKFLEINDGTEPRDVFIKGEPDLDIKEDVEDY